MKEARGVLGGVASQSWCGLAVPAHGVLQKEAGREVG